MPLRLFFTASGLFTKDCGCKMRVPVMSPWRVRLLVVVVVGTSFRKFSGKRRTAAAVEGAVTLQY